MRADTQGALLQLFFFKNIQNRKSSCAGDWIPSKGAEEFHPVVERIGDLRCRNHCRQRKRVADRFTKDDDIRNHSLRFESPEMRSQTTEPDLHFVGDTHRAGAAHVMVNLREITRRTNNLATDTWQRFRNRSEE